MKPFYHILRHHKYQALSGLTGLYLYTLLRDIGRGLVNIFIPIFIYKITNSLIMPFIFYAYYHFLTVLNMLWAPKVISKIGIDWSAAIGAFLRALSLVFFILAGQNVVFLYLAFTLWGILVAFTWIPHHFTVLKADDGDLHFGKESSLVLIFQQIAGAITPLVGGLIILLLGFDNLYKIAIVFIFLSAFPLFFDKIEKKDMHFSLPQLKKDIFDKKLKKINFGFLGEGLEGNSIVVLWPLFIYLYIGEVHKVGLVTAAALGISLIALFFMGKYTDKKGKNWSGKIFGLLLVVWLLKSFLRSALGFIGIDSAYYLLVSLAFLVYNATIYEFAVSKHRLEFLTRREMLYHAAGFLSCLLCAISISCFDFWLTGFLLAALGVWFIKRTVLNKR